MTDDLRTFYEFFAGGGMVRAGLGEDWQCLVANDMDEKKAASYAENWGSRHLRVCDVATLGTGDLPGRADLSWASFPCQDLSLAGLRAGIRGERSGSFWPFWTLMRRLNQEGRGPRVIILENVYGALRSHGGKDFAAIASAFSGANYRFGAVVADAVRFLPQSRPRLFVIGVHPDVVIPDRIVRASSDPMWHPKALEQAFGGLSKAAAAKWVWWHLGMPAPRTSRLADLIEDEPGGVDWHAPEQTRKLLDMMTPVNRKKVALAQRSGTRTVGTLYRRTRDGAVRAEVRFDDVAGCLRTPGGGSSRQTILVVDGDTIRSRLLSPREAARLMGLPDSYRLPANYNAAYHLAGDGVAVPVVSYLKARLLEPMLARSG